MTTPWTEVAGRVRDAAPLVHCLTATVSMSLVADALLSAGARPMMTETAQEAPTMTRIADSLLINLGTLSTDGTQGIPATVSAAVAEGHPWVLDPTAVGVAPVRTALAGQLLDQRPAIIRGNASEILALAGRGSGGRGADSTAMPRDALEAARSLALRCGAIVAVSGAIDLVVDVDRHTEVDAGSPLLPRLTGTGCLLGALCAACVVVTDPWSAALAATRWLDTAGELAASRATRPGSFRVTLIDALDEVGK